MKESKLIEIRNKVETLGGVANQLIREVNNIKQLALGTLATRVGYMGAGFLIAAQWTIDPKLYIIGFIFVMVQTASRKQWNLVALNMNGLIAWITHLIR